MTCRERAGTAQGIILGDDGERYTFTPLGWRDNSVSPQAGMRVDFEVRGSHAVGIYPIQGAAPTPPPVQPTPVPPTMQGAPSNRPPSQPLPPTQPAGAPPPLPPTQPAGAPPPVPPAAQSAPPPTTPPPPSGERSRMKGWHWAIAGGAALVIVGIVGAFALGIFPASDPGTENEAASQTPAVSATAGAGKSPLDDGGSQSEQPTASATSDSQSDGKPADYERVYQVNYDLMYSDRYDQLYYEQLDRLGTDELTQNQQRQFDRYATRAAEKYAAAYAEKYAMGRSIPFAEKYAELIEGGDSPERASAYAEVYVATGSKGDANAFANRIENGELKDYSKQIDSGKSHKYALAYAEQMEGGKSEEYAAAFAQQIEEGKSEETAATYARQIEGGSTESSAESHEFKLEWETSAAEIGEGESFTLTVRMYEVQEAGDHGGITVSFPSLTQGGGSKEGYSSSVAQVEAVDYTSGLSNVTFHQPGVNIYHKENNRQFPAEYLLVETDDASWSRSDDRTLQLRITPKRGGEFSIQIRGWLCEDEYSDCSRNPVEGAETDQQGWVVEAVSVSVGAASPAGQHSGEIGYATVVTTIGGNHTCAVRSDGTPECWGANDYGQASPPEGNFLKVCTGYDHSCALRTDGKAVCWGRNHHGQASSPVGDFTDIGAGVHCTCALDTNGTVVCWGRCERDDLNEFDRPPDGSFAGISLGAGHACVLSGSGEVQCWGDNRRGGATPPSGRFVEISAGSDHSCGLRANGEAECWGRDWDGYGAEDVPPGERFTSISAGSNHTCALRGDGSVLCWGRDDLGQSSPPAGSFKAISAGSRYSCAVREDGEVICWGANDDGRATPPQ